MQQSKFNSILESIVNVIFGYITAIIAQLIVYEMFDIDVPLSTNLQIGVWFTVIGLIRTYIIRRIFNKLKNFEFKNNEPSKDIRQIKDYIRVCIESTDKPVERAALLDDLSYVFDLKPEIAKQYLDEVLLMSYQNLYRELCKIVANINYQPNKK